MIWSDRKCLWLLFSSLFALLLELLSLLGITLPDTIALPFYLLVIFGIGYHTIWEGLKALFALNVKSINLLMLIAVCGAFYLAKYEEAAVVIVLYTLAEKLEDLGIKKSRSALEHLARRMPQSVKVSGKGMQPLSQIKVGDVIEAKPGSMLPVDGRVLSGMSTVDESTITGEPIPKDKTPGESIYSGTLNLQGYLEVEVTTLPKDSTLAKIQQLTFEAAQTKAETQKFIESFAQIYTPLIMLLAIGVTAVPVLFFGAEFDSWFLESLTLLVIACPCALVISTPISVYSAVGNASSQGVLIKGGRYLEALGRVKAIAFDKTKTLTVGKPCVTDVVAFGKNTKDDVLACAAGIEQFSEHPLSDSILNAAKEKQLTPHRVRDFQSVMGKGVKAHCTVCDSGHRCIGKLQFVLEEHDVPQNVLEEIDALQKEGKTVICISSHQDVIGLIALADTPRSDSLGLIQELRAMGIDSAMLTGDHQTVAEAVGKELGISFIYADLLPEGKVDRIAELQKKYGVTGMVGDGINDSPALAASSVGISMNSLGSDAALESADVVLLSDQLGLIPSMIRLGRRANRIIRTNIFFAVVVKLIFVSLALMGQSHLALAIFADVGVTILVIMNGLRLLALS